MNWGRQLNNKKNFFHYKQKYIIYVYYRQNILPMLILSCSNLTDIIVTGKAASCAL